MLQFHKLDFPEPDKPVITTNLFLGISKETFLRLCTLAPLMMSLSLFIIINLVIQCRSSPS